jgi:hypothetical protein
MRFTPEMIAAARASNQTSFESSDQLPEGDGVVFITAVADAPLVVLGRLGPDGRWYIGRFGISPLDQDPCSRLPAGILVLRNEPVAVAMIRQGIHRFLEAAAAGSPPNGFDCFMERLSSSRFGQSAIDSDDQHEKALTLQILRLVQREAPIGRLVGNALVHALSYAIVDMSVAARDPDPEPMLDQFVHMLRASVRINFGSHVKPAAH